ncbi:MAG: hypothetical protein HQM11_10565 [SAR324 cluster bacterium]|nr:hypothetical protein [SAR324 cluster bacterium]
MKLINMIDNSVHRGSHLTKKIMEFGKKNSNKKQRLNLSEFLVHELDLLKSLIPQKVAHGLEIQRENILITADPGTISEIMLNLCVNSVHAMLPGGGLLTISLRYVTECDDHACEACPLYREASRN